MRYPIATVFAVLVAITAGQAAVLGPGHDDALPAHVRGQVAARLGEVIAG